MREPAACCAGFRSARDLEQSGPIEVMLLVCLCDLLRGKREGVTHAWVEKTWTGSVKWRRVIGSQLSKDSATGFTISCIPECISPFRILINP